MGKSAIQPVKDGQKYFFEFRKNSDIIRYEVRPTERENSMEIEVNGHIYPLKKPLANITEFSRFCVETDLY